MNIKKILKNEFINGKSLFDWVWLGVGLLMQVIAIMYGYLTGSPDSAISIIAGIAGVVTVILCAQGKISTYLFGYIQILTYTLGVAIPNHLWGESWENLFYFITQTIAIFIWYKNYKKTDKESTEVVCKKLTKLGWAVTTAYLVVGTTVLALVLRKTSDPAPFMDAVSTIPAFSAQILMVFRYREQWLHWLIIDVTSVIMFIILGNWMMVAMFAFWTLNCVYGWYKYTKSANYKGWKEIK